MTFSLKKIVTTKLKLRPISFIQKMIDKEFQYDLNKYKYWILFTTWYLRFTKVRTYYQIFWIFYQSFFPLRGLFFNIIIRPRFQLFWA